MLPVLISIGGLLIAAIGLPLLYFQLRGVQQTLQSTTHAAIYEQAADFRGYLIQYPHLRKYFFDNEEIESDNEEYNRVLSIAEIYLNYLEQIAVLQNSFGKENIVSLTRFVNSAFDKSPILRKLLSQNATFYSKALHSARTRKQ